jgi:hypothetical protein
MVKEGEYDVNIVYSCMQMEKMRPVETIPRMRGGRDKEWWKG